MAIVKITGASGTGKSFVAAALRNNQISNGHGALLIDEQNEGELDIMLEKIIVGVNLPKEIPKNWAEIIPWKPNSSIILVGEKVSLLGDIEKRLPGFTDVFSPVYEINLNA